MLSATYEDGKTIEYTYDNRGRTATVSDSSSGTVSSLGYDYMDRVSVYTEENPDNKLTLSYSYYVANKKLKTLLEEINGHPRGASYVYDNDERLKSYQKANGKREYTYDDFDRVPSYVTQHKNTNDEFDTVLTTAFTFASSAVSTTSTRVASMRQEGNGFTQDYSYTYDKNGNILSVTDPNGTTTYEYDSLGQLLRENNFAGNFTHVWEYDRAGNIKSRKEYAYTTGTISQNDTPVDTVLYTYGDADWGDLLTAYDGSAITYDGIGNPLNDGTWTYSWQHGRQLASMTSGETTWTYTYNADGLRTKRTDGTNTYEYVYYDGLLQYMEYNNTPVYFTHAPDGTPMGMLTDGEAYFYITNLQGDVVGIVDATGNLLVSYTYDAWGNPLSVTGTLANTIGTLNPFRYRGYVYDAEIRLYYVASRYYDAEIGRWINADDTAYLGADNTLLSYNLFTYCKNTPVIGYDPTGHFSWNDLFNVAAVVTVAAIAVVAVVGSGGAAAAPILAAASALAGTTVTAATATTVAAGVAITGLATMQIAASASLHESSGNNNPNQNNNYTGRSTYNKHGDRIDLEYYGNGNGNVHYDGTKGKEVIWRLEDGVQTVYNVSKAVSKIISKPSVHRAIIKGIEIVLSLANKQ